jgi:ATP-dependent Clp protease ATP-binding subunit ClpA
MWFGCDRELKTNRFSGALDDLLAESIVLAQDQKLSAFSPQSILYYLFAAGMDDRLLAKVPQQHRPELRNATLLLRNHLKNDATPNHGLALCISLRVPEKQGANLFLRENWPDALAELVEGLPADASLHSFLNALFERRSALFSPKALDALEKLLTVFDASEENIELFEAQAFNRKAIRNRFYRLLECSLLIAGERDQPVVKNLTILYATLQVGETYTCFLLRKAGITPMSDRANNAFERVLGARARSGSLPMAHDSFDADAIELLNAALNRALETGMRQLGEREFLSALFASGDARLTGFLEHALGWPLKTLGTLLDDLPEPDEIEPALPQGHYPIVQLSAVEKPLVHRQALEEEIIGALLRKDCHTVLLLGESGCGRTSLMTRVAQTLREKAYASLRFTPVFYMDLSMLGDGEYETSVQQLFTFMEENPGRIYVADGFCRYFLGHIRSVGNRLAASAYKFVMIATPEEYENLQTPKETNDLQAITKLLQENVTLVQIEEPARDETIAMIDMALPEVESTYGLQAEPGISTALYRMCSDYMISQRFPCKAIRLLNQAASDIAAQAELRGVRDARLTKESIARRLSSLTELPADTILGQGDEKDFSGILGNAVLGQGAAVARVADRLDLLQKGLTEKNKPAAIFLFVGLSGTGKTELAKQIAQVYSRSRKLITFEMTTFPEAHSVSGLIGSPPGYVGYEEGGRLINALNRDPYSVVLLDEIEKAHPTVWDLFLSLFDDGMITDRRGVSAYGYKAFFIMTSNIAQLKIVDMLSNGTSPESVEEAVIREISEYRFQPEKGAASQLCFRPEFLGRILSGGGIVVFNALSRDAMIGIAEQRAHILCQRHAATFESSRLIIDEDVTNFVGTVAYQQSEESIRRRSFYMGGRLLAGLMDRYVASKLSAQIRQIAGTPLVRVALNGNDTEIIPIYGDGEAERLLAERREKLSVKVFERLRQLTGLPPDALCAITDGQLYRLNALLAEITTQKGAET